MHPSQSVLIFDNHVIFRAGERRQKISQKNAFALNLRIPLRILMELVSKVLVPYSSQVYIRTYDHLSLQRNFVSNVCTAIFEHDFMNISLKPKWRGQISTYVFERQSVTPSCSWNPNTFWRHSCLRFFSQPGFW